LVPHFPYAFEQRQDEISRSGFNLSRDFGEKRSSNPLMNSIELVQRHQTLNEHSDPGVSEGAEPFREILNAIPVMIWMSDATKACTWFNKRWLDFTGRTMEQEFGYGWAEGVHPDDFERCVSTYNEAFDRHEPFRMDYQLRRHDGAWRIINDLGVPRFSSEGTFLGYIGSCLDVTDYRTAEWSMPESEEHFGETLRAPENEIEAIVHHTPFLLTYCSSDLRYRYISTAYAKMIGRRAEDVAGKPIIDIMGEDGFNTILPYIRKVLQGHQVAYESKVHFKDAGSRFLRATYTPKKNDQGRIEGWVASIIDVTEQKRLEAMTLLHELARFCIRDGGPLDEGLQRILDTAIAIMAAKKGNLQLLDPSSGALVIAAQRGFDKPFLEYFEHVDVKEASACAAAWRAGRQVIIDDVLESEVFAGQPSQKVLLEEVIRSVISTPLMSDNGQFAGMLSTHFVQPRRPDKRELQLMELLATKAANYLERKDAEETRMRQEEHIRLLMREVNHRSKNILSVVRAIAFQTKATDLGDFLDRFSKRIDALAANQDLLIENDWKGVAIEDLVRSQLAHFEDLIGTRIEITGPALTITAKAAQAIGMALHELAVNAVKYGALASTPGRIVIEWGVEDSFHMTWREKVSGPITPPSRRGFGSAVICDLVEASLGGKVELDFASTGMTWRLTCAVGDVLTEITSTPKDVIELK
jgi:PAS domain S-box-containing protein